MTKKYQTPTTIVVAIRHRSSLMAGSPAVSGLDGFGKNRGYYDEEDDAD